MENWWHMVGPGHFKNPKEPMVFMKENWWRTGRFMACYLIDFFLQVFRTMGTSQNWFFDFWELWLWILRTGLITKGGALFLFHSNLHDQAVYLVHNIRVHNGRIQGEAKNQPYSRKGLGCHHHELHIPPLGHLQRPMSTFIQWFFFLLHFSPLWQLWSYMHKDHLL